jgi:predicted transcriptional regulator
MPLHNPIYIMLAAAVLAFLVTFVTAPPLIRVLRPGKPPVVRITPLTNHDVVKIFEATDLAGERGIEELLGRVSQLI